MTKNGKLNTKDGAVRNEKGEEIIVPYHDDLLESFDLRKQRLSLNLPEELLTLNA